MNLHKFIALALFILAGSVNAVLDVKNLPEAAPAELQDKLAWGLCKSDKRVVAEALDQGANPYEIEIADKDFNTVFFVNAYEIASGWIMADQKYDEIYHKIWFDEAMVTADEIAYIAYTWRTIFEMCELLVIKGVSVDTATYQFPYSQKESVRTLVQRIVDAQTNDRDDREFYAQEFIEHFKARGERLQQLIDKYQPVQK